MEIGTFALHIYETLWQLRTNELVLKGRVSQDGDFSFLLGQRPTPGPVDEEGRETVTVQGRDNVVLLLCAGAISGMEEYAKRLGMTTTLGRIRDAKIILRMEQGCITGKPLASELSRQLEFVRRTAEDELYSRFFAYIPSDRVEYLRSPHPFGQRVAEQFPSTVGEIEAATRAIAFDLPMACIFHVMRTVEKAFKGIDLFLSLDPPDGLTARTWGAFRKRMEVRFEALGKDWRNSNEGEFFKKIHGDIGTIQIAWRDTSLHVDREYSLAEAENIFKTVKMMMENLAQHLDQNGNFTP
jgi:hypothetical protein